MSGVDIFIAILCGVMFFGGLYLNHKSRKLAEQYAESHKTESPVQKSAASRKGKVQRRNS